MGKLVGTIARIGATLALSSVLTPFVGGAIVGIGGGTFGALGVSLATRGIISLGLSSVIVNAGFGALGFNPSAPKPEQTDTAIKTTRPPRVAAYGRSRLYWAYALFETADNGTAVDVGVYHDGLIDGIEAYYLADDKVTLSGTNVQQLPDKRYGSNSVNVYTTLGQTPGTANFPSIMSLLPGIWDGNRRGDGCVVAAVTFKPVKSKRYLETYPNGQPPLSIVARWQKCPDLHSADPLDQSQWTWTENPIRQLAHYKIVRERVDFATKIAPTIAYWRDAQDVCDEAVALKAGGTEPRYRSCLSHKLTDPPKAVTAALMATCDGWLCTRADGALIVYAGKYIAPTVSIGPEHIIGYDWEGVGVDDDTAFNELTLTYVSADHDFNSPDADPWTDEADIAKRGAVISDSMELPVPSNGQARRLAKIRMSGLLALNRGTVTTNVEGRIVRGHRFINLRIADAGTVFFEGVAEVTSLTRNLQGGVVFGWRKADPNRYAWNPATEEGDPAPVGNRVARQPLDAPEIDTAIPEVASDGTSAQVRLTVTGPDRDDLTWFVRWKVSTDAVWNEAEYSDIDPGASVELLTGTVPQAVSLDVEVAYQVGDGRVSPWSDTEAVDTSSEIILDGGDATTEV